MLLNRERLIEKMEKYEIDSLVATSSVNVFYTSDLAPYGNCFTLLPYDRGLKPVIIAPISAPTPIVLMSPPWIDDIRYYGEFYTTTEQTREPLTIAEEKLFRAQNSWERSKKTDPITILIDLLKEKDITKGKIGVDESNLPLNLPFWKKIVDVLPDLEVIPAQNIFKEIRMVKSDEEIKRIQEAVKITEKAWNTAIENTREGITEKEFGEIYQHTIISEGGKISSHMGMYGPPIAFGRRTAFVDIASPSNYRLKKGDIIRFDGGCSYKGYPCDMARTSVLGHPSNKLRKYWNAIFRGEQLAINNAKPGVKASDIFNSVVNEIKNSGIKHYRRHHTGHGWGIEGYDPPLISPNDHTLLEEGMVLCFETPYYEIGWGGILHEDIVVITKNGSRYLTTFEGELRKINY